MRFLPVLLLFLTSCSAVWHVNRAIEKDPNIIKPDTITVERTIVGDTGQQVGMDSVLIDNSRVWIKALGEGKIDLSYIVKDIQIVDTTDITVVPSAPKKRWERRADRKDERQRGRRDDRERNDGLKMKREDRRTVEAIESTKKVVERHKGWNLLWVGICIGLAISTLCRFLIKRFLANFVG
jgi:hypothetical protein